MSVAEPLRYKGRLKVHTKAEFLASYTAKILQNENVFNPEIDPVLINRMKNCVYDIYIKAWQANKLSLDKNPVERSMRFKLQKEAVILCDELYASIGIAKMLFHLRHKRMKYWSGLIMDVRALLQGWIESDVKRS